QLGAVAIIRAEITSTQEWYVHRVQVAVADAGHVSSDELWRNVRFRGQRDSFDAVSEVERKAVRYSYGGQPTRFRQTFRGGSDLESAVLGGDRVERQWHGIQ